MVLLDQSSPSISLLSQLHWLPVAKRIEFKIATLTYQSVTFGQPHALLTLVRALIVSKVDYCNSVLAGMSRHLHDRLQSVLSLFRCVLTPLMEAHCTPYWYIYHPTLWVRSRENTILWGSPPYTSHVRNYPVSADAVDDPAKCGGETRASPVCRDGDSRRRSETLLMTTAISSGELVACCTSGNEVMFLMLVCVCV